MKSLPGLLGAAAVATFPLLLLAALQWLDLRTAALLFAAAAALRLLALRGRGGTALPAAALAALLLACAGLALASGEPHWFRFYPVAVNGVLLLLFGASLWRGPPVAERLARLREPDLPPAAVHYTRQVTRAWCAFFLVNGGLALYTALTASLEVWALYNGVIAYLLMGCLFAGEWLLRRRVRRRQHA